jgi:NitT/TauT family transport system substrate-binding protein
MRLVSAATYIILCALSSAWAVDGPIRVATDDWVANYPLNVAQDKGFFAAEGLQVELISYESDNDRTTATRTGKVHFGTSMLGSAITWRLAGDPIIILAETDWSHGGDRFITAPGIDPKALAGKRVGVYQDDVAVGFFLHKALAVHGLSVAQAELVELEPDPLTAQLIAGKLPAIVNYDPAASAAVAGGGTLRATTADFPGVMPEGLVGHRDRLRELGADRLTRFMRAWVRAVAWAGDPANRAEFGTILRTKTLAGPDQPTDDAAALASLSGVRVHDSATLAERNRTGLPAWLAEVEAYLAVRGIPTKLPPAELIDTAGVLAATAKP